MQEKYLIMKLDEQSLTHFPERLSDVPLPLITDIPADKLQEYHQIILKGDAFDLKTLQTIIFPVQFHDFR